MIETSPLGPLRMMTSADIWAELEGPRDLLTVELTLAEVLHVIALLGGSELDDQLAQKLGREIAAQKLACWNS
jgi:hypothetical protein